jgi:3,2-trans-enoyl-CoA isomerase
MISGSTTLILTTLTKLNILLNRSPAGGCLLAMSCDYRVMVRNKFTIGLNETKLGIVAPYWFKVSCPQVNSVL